MTGPGLQYSPRPHAKITEWKVILNKRTPAMAQAMDCSWTLLLFCSKRTRLFLNVCVLTPDHEKGAAPAAATSSSPPEILRTKEDQASRRVALSVSKKPITATKAAAAVYEKLLYKDVSKSPSLACPGRPPHGMFK